MTDKPAPRRSLLFHRWTFPGARPYHGGATVDPKTGERYTKDEGYAVGSTQDTAAKASIAGPNRLAHEKAAQQRLDRRHGAELRTGGYVGSWRENGKIHYDPVQIVEDRDDAISMAKKRNQKAIWDLKNKREISIE